jgi:hypothetical protein
LNVSCNVFIILADDEDPYRAIVRWYSRPKDVPKRTIRFLQLDMKVEVILDERPFDNDVSIETFFSNCVVSCDPTGTLKTPQSSELCASYFLHRSLEDSGCAYFPFS